MIRSSDCCSLLVFIQGPTKCSNICYASFSQVTPRCARNCRLSRLFEQVGSRKVSLVSLGKDKNTLVHKGCTNFPTMSSKPTWRICLIEFNMVFTFLTTPERKITFNWVLFKQQTAFSMGVHVPTRKAGKSRVGDDSFRVFF